jgi:hypothetical protein
MEGREGWEELAQDRLDGPIKEYDREQKDEEEGAAQA